jgi:hypothetical protein
MGRNSGDMKLLLFAQKPAQIFHLPEHGGDSVKGGGHPASETVPAEEEIEDAQGNMIGSRGRTPGTNDPGVPGSRTQTGVGDESDIDSGRANPHPGPGTGEGSGSGGADHGGELDDRKF